MSIATADEGAVADDGEAVADAELVGVVGSDAGKLDFSSFPHPAAATAKTAKTATNFLMLLTFISIKDEFRFRQHCCDCRDFVWLVA
ncbi:hypothetical protein [Dactylosporangium sp. NPDC051484]|uniref:hypothetical protein n=1 Tax=Dactylosporangium sp. NPDC051484 TaxID=3154942 RepID=UPI00344C477D